MHRIRRLFLMLPVATLARAQSASSVILASSQDPSNYGQGVTLTATVTAGATGRVTFYDGTTVLGVSPIAVGQAAFTTALLTSGARHLRAHYSGDTAYSPSNSAAMTQTVVAQPSLGLKAPVNYEVGGAKQAVVADFNGDGKPDLAITAFPGTPSGGILLGNGDGTFRVTSMNLTTYMISAATGDFNQDGKQDLVFVDLSSGRLSVALGNGDGTFGAPATYSIGSTSIDPVVVVGDFNGDGIADLAVSLHTSVGIMLGKGDGTFQSVVTYPVANAVMLASGDFNGDGDTDLVVGGQDAMNMSILPGNGDGTFQAPIAVATPAYPQFFIVEDFDGDGRADLALTSALTNSVYVLLGNGNLTFQAPVGYVAGATENWSLAAGDIDGDGKLDLIVLDLNPNTLSVVPGNGDGTFQPPLSYPAGNGLNFYAVVGDFNADGKTDVAEIIGGQVGVLLGGAVPDLSISLAPGPGFTSGQTGATYTITVTNASTLSSAGAVCVVDALPSGFTATGISGAGWICGLPTLSCTRSGPLAPAASYPDIVITANISPSTTGAAVASATVSGGGDQNPANNTATSSVSLRTLPAVSLTSSPNPSTLGQIVTFTANTNPTATGEMTFFDGVDPLGSAAVAGGQATFTTGLLPSGTRNLIAEYNGGSNYGSSTSAAHIQTVNAAPDDAALPSPGYKVDLSPQYEATGDFNRDGKLDLVTANLGSGNAGSVSVLLGNGDGTFQAAINSPAGSNPGFVAVGDFNEDGKPDLAVIGLYGISILLGNGDGSFQPPTLISSGQSDFQGLAVADFNRDGTPDVLAVNEVSGIYVFLGKGDGTFSSGRNTAFPVTGWTVADWNGDGTPDVAVGSDIYGASLSILLGNGDGTFQAPLHASLAISSDYPEALASGDFNGDGKPDLAAVYTTSGIAVLLGNGDGAFQTPVHSDVLTVANYVVAGDFNGDGKLDFAYTKNGSLNLTLAFGNGDGTFQSGIMLPTTGSGNIVLGDFNRDGKPDFATSDRGANVVKILSGAQLAGLSIAPTHTGSFHVGQTGATYQLTVSNPQFQSPAGTVSVIDTLPAGFTATAMGGTGWSCVVRTLTCSRSDALLSGLSYPPITLTVNLSNSIVPSTIDNRASVTSDSGTNAAADPTAILSASVTSLNIAPGSSSFGNPVSLNATMGTGETGAVLFLDGMTVLGVSTILGGNANLTTSLLPAGVRELRAFYGGDATHAGGFSTTTSFSVSTSPAGAFGTVLSNPTGSNPVGIAIGDFNNDGKADLATANSGGNTVSVLLGNGDGTFRQQVDYTVGAKPVAVAAGDFNGDGNQDMAVINQTGLTVAILLGNGDGTFNAAVSMPLDSSPSSVAVGDFNGDGIEDVAVGSALSFTLSVFFGKGDGSFRQPVISNTYTGTQLLVVDLNGDGNADLLVGNTYFYALLGNGNGGFQLTPWVGYGLGGLAAGDLNGDGETDVIFPVGGGPWGLTVQLGSGDGNFIGSQTYPVSFDPSSLVMTDVNGDGNLDVIGSSITGSSIVILLGNGDGTLQPAVYYNIGFSPAGMIVGEFNGDGRADLALAESSTNSLGIALGIKGSTVPAAFFDGQASLGSSVYYLQFPNGNWFGYYNLSYFPILYHYDMGFESFIDGGNGAAYMYDFTSGHWWYTSATLFPYLYDFNLNNWLYYFPDPKNAGHYSANPRYFSDLTTGKIITI